MLPQPVREPRLQLAGALAREAELLPHLLQRLRLAFVHAEAARPAPRTLQGLERVVEALRGPIAAWSGRRDLERLEAGTYYGDETPLAVTRTDLRVERGRTYHMVVTRRGGTLRWEIDGVPALELVDPAPLSGSSHDRFGFSSWANDTYFDNLEITPL